MKEDVKDNSVLIPKIEPENTLPENSAPETKSDPRPADPPKINKKMLPWQKILIGLGGVILFLLVVFGIFAIGIYQKSMALVVSGKKLNAAVKTQDLTQIKTGLDDVSAKLASFKSFYSIFSWTRFVPFAGPYVADIGHGINAGQAGIDAAKIVLTSIEPYADLLGFKGNVQAAATAGDGAKTAQDRIDFVVKSLPSLLPQIDAISAKVEIVQNEISGINPDRYPQSFKGTQVRSQIVNAQDIVGQAATLLVNGKPLIESAPYLLGMDSPRTYLVLFQNDKELRPTGGFMTAYSIMKVDKAKFQPVSSNDIYNLDAQYRPSTPAPAPIVKYIKGPYILSQNLRLRDMNWSPDFAVSMQSVTTAVKQVGITNIDGIIGVDTQLLTDLLDVIGPIGVPGFGNFSTKIVPECNCAQVIHELESFADVEGPIIWDPVTGKIILRPPNSDNRKKIIGPLMNSILSNAMGQPKDKLAPLFEAAYKSLIEKHVLLYMMDSTKEKAVSDFGIGGTIKDYAGDYLHINDANLGGRKSNLYATEDVEQDIQVGSGGTVTKSVTITYKNPQSQDGWLNSVLPTWVRVYVPKGSQLVAAEGLEAKADPYEDLGKTVFAGYFQLRPEGVAKVTFKYTLPMKFSGSYKLSIQKQPGTDGFLYTINLGRHQEEFYLKTDKEIKIGI